MSPTPLSPTDLQRQALSQLLDGELPDGDARACCRGWRDTPELQRNWHVWQLIGDVLRSDELAQAPAADAAFLARLQQRLAHEPVPFTPAAARAERPSPADHGLRPGPEVQAQGMASRGRRRWLPSAAVAAGVMAVVGATAVFSLREAAAPGGALAGGPWAALGLESAAALGHGSAAALAGSPSPARGWAGGGASLGVQTLAPEQQSQMIRDARLDQYLAAHRRLAGGLGPTAGGGLQVQYSSVAVGR